MVWSGTAKTKEPENKQKAYEYAVFLLSLQLRTVGEIREKMERRGYTAAILEQVMDQLCGQKYLDDERYAQVFLDNLKQYKNLGYFGIKKKFMLKKLSMDVIEKTLEEGLTKEEELKIAMRFLKKEGVAVEPSLSDEETSAVTYSTFNEEKNKQKQKLAQKLKSRGFRGDIIAKLIF